MSDFGEIEMDQEDAAYWIIRMARVGNIKDAKNSILDIIKQAYEKGLKDGAKEKWSPPKISKEEFDAIEKPTIGLMFEINETGDYYVYAYDGWQIILPG